MKSIRIDNQLTTSARAHIYPSSESLLGVIEIRESLLTERISFDLWVSWKEQLNFGAPRSHVVVSPDLPLVQTNLPQDSETMLYVLMVHEFAHLLDSMNHINHYSCEERPQDPWCRRPSWDSLNQTDDGKELPENSSPLIKQLCFYECFNQKIPASQQAKLYQDLLKSTFVDSYATGNNLEDFAESFVFYHLDEEPTARYQLVTPGKTFDLMARFRSEKFAVKRAFLKHFLASSEIIYPGKRKKRTR